MERIKLTETLFDNINFPLLVWKYAKGYKNASEYFKTIVQLTELFTAKED